MLKVTLVDGATERRLMVEGTLTGASVPELESAWKKTLNTGDSRKLVVDLSETTLIDGQGKKALMAMASQGAELVAKGVYTGYVVKGLMERVHAGCRS
jgi:anti-anti-sigma regulatory factor